MSTETRTAAGASGPQLERLVEAERELASLVESARAEAVAMLRDARSRVHGMGEARRAELRGRLDALESRIAAEIGEREAPLLESLQRRTRLYADLPGSEVERWAEWLVARVVEESA